MLRGALFCGALPRVTLHSDLLVIEQRAGGESMGPMAPLAGAETRSVVIFLNNPPAPPDDKFDD